MKKLSLVVGALTVSCITAFGQNTEKQQETPVSVKALPEKPKTIDVPTVKIQQQEKHEQPLSATPKRTIISTRKNN